MTQRSTLFDFAVRGMKAQAEVNKLCHKSDPCTSHDAADKIVKSGALSRQEERVLDAIKCYICHSCKYDFTAKDIFTSSTISYYTIQRRLSGLHNKGKIERIQSGLRSVRSGNLIPKKRDGCCVWRLK